MAGMLAAPVNLGVWLAHGRALRARKERRVRKEVEVGHWNLRRLRLRRIIVA